MKKTILTEKGFELLKIRLNEKIENLKKIREEKKKKTEQKKGFRRGGKEGEALQKRETTKKENNKIEPAKTPQKRNTTINHRPKQ